MVAKSIIKEICSQALGRIFQVITTTLTKKLKILNLGKVVENRTYLMVGT